MSKTVIITGASKGIGAATARLFAENDYNVVINYLTSKESAETLKKELETLKKGKIIVMQGDVSKEQDALKIIEKTIENFEKIDCLVNNAAMAIDNEPLEKSSEEFKTVLNNNLIGPFLMCKYVGNHMKENKQGKIINVASTNGIDTNNTYSMDYDASKSGLISLTHNFAKYLAPYVNVNAVAPGWTNTELVLEMNPNLIKEEKEKILLKRFAEPKEIANAIYFLASETSNYINNEILRIDGGWN